MMASGAFLQREAPPISENGSHLREEAPHGLHERLKAVPVDRVTCAGDVRNLSLFQQTQCLLCQRG